MKQATDRDRQAPKFELRFRSLFRPGAGYAFPCDVDGHVDLDALTEAGRNHYFFARTVVGSELTMPTVDRAVAGCRKKRPSTADSACSHGRGLRGPDDTIQAASQVTG